MDTLMMTKRGFSTIEIMIAMALAVLIFVAVIPLTFGNQSGILGGETNAEALHAAQGFIEKAEAEARRNYDQVVAYTPAPIAPYTFSVTVPPSLVTECGKGVTSRAEWLGEHGQPLYVTLTSLVVDLPAIIAKGGDCNTIPPGDWSNPTTYGISPPNVVDGQGRSVDVAMVQGAPYAFIGTYNSATNKNDLWSFDVSQPQAPVLLSATNVADAVNAVDTAHDYATGKDYAYLATSSQNPAGSCGGGAKPFVNQFEVVDVSNPNALALVASRTLSAVDPCGSEPAGASIYYYKNKVYVGTKETAGDELTIFTVTDPTNPVETGSLSVNRNVNAIVVEGGVAYLATGSGVSGTHNPLKIYDVNPASLTYGSQLGTFTATGDEEGTSLALVNHTLYLGLERTTGTRPNFYVIDVSDPLNPLTLGSWRVPLHTNAAISGIAVAGSLAFLSTTDSNWPFYILVISNPLTISPLSNCIPYNYSQETNGLVYKDNIVYVVDRSQAGLRTLYGKPIACPL